NTFRTTDAPPFAFLDFHERILLQPDDIRGETQLGTPVPQRRNGSRWVALPAGTVSRTEHVRCNGNRDQFGYCQSTADLRASVELSRRPGICLWEHHWVQRRKFESCDDTPMQFPRVA